MILNSGGYALWTFHSGDQSCADYKIDNLVEPYINLPDISAILGDYNSFCTISNDLPRYKSSILTIPNNIIGREIAVSEVIAFDGLDDGSVLSSLTILTGGGSLNVGAVYSDIDVVVPGGRYILWGAVFTDFNFEYNDVFANFLEFLLSECDVSSECDGYECGTGDCGGTCLNTCAPGDVCSGNVCVEGCTGSACSIFSLPEATSKWSVYHTGCITWDIDALQERYGDIYLEYGIESSGSSQMREIVSSFDLSLGEYEWLVFGCYPGKVRIVIVYTSSGNTEASPEFNLYSPSSRYSNTC